MAWVWGHRTICLQRLCGHLGCSICTSARWTNAQCRPFPMSLTSARRGLLRRTRSFDLARANHVRRDSIRRPGEWEQRQAPALWHSSALRRATRHTATGTGTGTGTGPPPTRRQRAAETMAQVASYSVAAQLCSSLRPLCKFKRPECAKLQTPSAQAANSNSNYTYRASKSYNYPVGRPGAFLTIS